MSVSVGELLLAAACFKLGFVGAQLTQEFSERVEAVGLTHKQVGLLAVVDAGLASSQKEIASSLGVAPSLVVALVDQLVEVGAVSRRRSTEDRRIQNIELTSLGRDMLLSSSSVAEELDERVFAALSKDGRAALSLVLAELSIVHIVANGDV